MNASEKARQIVASILDPEGGDAYLTSHHCPAADDLRERIATALLEAEKAALEKAWQPIETAPKDGSEFLGFLLGMRLVLYYDDRPERGTHPWGAVDGGYYHRNAPSRWMPLPPPPAIPSSNDEKTGS